MKIHPTLLLLTALAAAAPLAAADAPKIWKAQCAECHGPNGKGHTKIGRKLKIPDLSQSKVQALFTDEQAFKIIKEGVKDDEQKVSMKPAEGVTDDEIRALVKVIRGFRKP